MSNDTLRRRALRCAIIDCTRQGRYDALMRLAHRELERATGTDAEAARALDRCEAFTRAAKAALRSFVVLP